LSTQIKSIFPNLDQSRWTKGHTKIFSTISLGFLLDGFVFSTVPLSIAFLVPSSYYVPVLAIDSLSLLAGNVLLGYFADKFGRRKMFMLTMSIYAVGLIFTSVSSSFLEVLVFTSMMNFGVGGEEPPALAALAETMPASNRGKIIVASANFYNVGAAVASGLSILFASIFAGREIVYFLYGSAVVMVLVVAMARFLLPESPRWLFAKGQSARAYSIASQISLNNVRPQEDQEIVSSAATKVSGRTYTGRFALLWVLGVSQLTTYTLLAYYLGPLNFSSETAVLILVANMAATVGGFGLLFLFDRGRKLTSLVGFGGGTLTALLLIPFVNNFEAFLSLLFVNMVFSEIGWASRLMLEPELFPTGLRGTSIGISRIGAWSVNSLIVFVTYALTVENYLALIASLWCLGLVAASIWALKGRETARRSVDATFR
jgi:putative MFS transporter